MENQILTELNKKEINKFIDMVHRLYLKKQVSQYSAYEECKRFMIQYKMSSKEYESYIKLLENLLKL
jgi:hypothetical protein